MPNSYTFSEVFSVQYDVWTGKWMIFDGKIYRYPTALEETREKIGAILLPEKRCWRKKKKLRKIDTYIRSESET